jgi:non-ribosomal peptide synthetase component F
MRNYPRGEKSFREFLEEVNNNSLKAYENQDYQFDELVKDLGIERDPARSPIFDVHFTLQNTNIKRISTNKEVRKLGFSYYPYHMKSTQFDIIIHGFDRGRVISFVLRYCTSLFKRATIEKFARDYKVVAAAVVENIETKLGDIALYHGLYDKKLSVPQADFAF